MRKFIAAVLLFAAAPVTAGEEAKGAVPRGTGSMAAADVSSEALVRKMYDEYEAAWNRHDAATMAGLWAEDGDRIESDGAQAKGRRNVENLLREQHEGVSKESLLSLSLDSVWFIVDGVALADGSYTVTGIRDRDGKVVEPRRGRLSDVLVRHGGTWQIGASRVMAEPLPALPTKD